MKRYLGSLLVALAGAVLLFALTACGSEQVEVPEDKEEAYTFTGSHISEDKTTVVNYILHCYTDNTLVLECHQNRGGTWSEDAENGLELTIGSEHYTAKKSQYTGKLSFKFNDTIGSQPLTVRLETAMDDSLAGTETDQMLIEVYADTVKEMVRTYAGREGEVIFYDASNFVRWETLEDQMEGYPIQNKSFGGSNDVSRQHYAKDLIYDSKPAILVTINDSNNWTRGQTLEEVTAFRQTFFDEMGVQLPDTVFVILSSTPNPLRFFGEYHDKMVGSDQWVQDYCAGHENFEYLDVVVPLSLEDGAAPNPELWIEDDLHLNQAGYDILGRMIREKLDEICAARGITFN